MELEIRLNAASMTAWQHASVLAGIIVIIFIIFNCLRKNLVFSVLLTNFTRRRTIKVILPRTVACNSILARCRMKWGVIAFLASRHVSACAALLEISSKTLTACHGIWDVAVLTYSMHEIRFATIIAWTPLLAQMSSWKSALSRSSFTA